MALKDLIAQQSALTEEAIESIIKDYARYDVARKEIVFLPAASSLAGKQKLLVYLVALQGWPIVAEGEEIPTTAKPAQIGDQVGIAGGTLRPFLKDLKDRHLIAWKDGAYSVLAASLNDIKAELDGAVTTRKPVKTKRSAKKQRETTAGNADAKRKRRSGSGRSSNLSDKFNGWIEAGWFDEGRTLNDVRSRFHKGGDIIPITSVPGYLLVAVRAGRLMRDKEAVNGKKVWVYSTAK
jgi:hypothetical protein